MFERSYTVLPSDVGARGTMKPRNFLNFLQDTADMAVKDLGADILDMIERGYAWVLVNSKISVLRYPVLGEKLTIRTWHSLPEGLYTYRAFDVRSQLDRSRPVLLGSTSWILIDLTRTRPVKPKEHMTDSFIDDQTQDVPEDFSDLPRHPESDVFDERVFRVRMHDLDPNEHVNNAVYVEWAVESVPVEVLQEFRLTDWEVSYRKSAKFGDTVLVRTCADTTDNASPTFTATMTVGDKFLCTVRTVWERNDNH